MCSLSNFALQLFAVVASASSLGFTKPSGQSLLLGMFPQSNSPNLAERAVAKRLELQERAVAKRQARGQQAAKAAIQAMEAHKGAHFQKLTFSNTLPQMKHIRF